MVVQRFVGTNADSAKEHTHLHRHQPPGGTVHDFLHNAASAATDLADNFQIVDANIVLQGVGCAGSGRGA